MLGSITRSLNEVFTRLGSIPFTAEAKLDGQRVQIHARLDGPQGEEDGGGRWVAGDDGTKVWVRLFSRSVLSFRVPAALVKSYKLSSTLAFAVLRTMC